MDELDAAGGGDQHPRRLPDDEASEPHRAEPPTRRSVTPAALVAAALGVGLEAIVAIVDALRLLGEATLQEETLGLAGIRLLNREAPAAGALVAFAAVAVATAIGLLGRSRSAWAAALALQALIAVDALVRLPSGPIPAVLALLLAGSVAFALLRSATRSSLRPPAR